MQENASCKTVRYRLSWLLFAGNETICKMLEARIGLADEKKEIEREKRRRTLCVQTLVTESTRGSLGDPLLTEFRVSTRNLTSLETLLLPLPDNKQLLLVRDAQSAKHYLFSRILQRPFLPNTFTTHSNFMNVFCPGSRDGEICYFIIFDSCWLLYRILVLSKRFTSWEIFLFMKSILF